MLWLALSLFTAVSVAVRDAIVKRGARALDEYTAVLGISATTAAAMAVPFLVGRPFPELGPRLPVALLGSGLPNVLAYILLAKAVKRSDLSLVAPLMGLTPLFLLLTSPLIVGEVAGPWGVAGVLLIVAGTYLLNLRDLRHGPLEPLRVLLRDPGARMMLAVAFIWSISANFDKVGVEASSPFAWVLLINVTIATTMGLIVLARRAGRWTPAPAIAAEAAAGRRREVALVLAGGAINAASLAAQMTALTLTLVPYVIAVKRSSVLFSVALGWIFFGERRIRERALGAALILAGVVLFSLR